MDLSEFSAYFLGSYGENNSEFEQIFLEFFRDHIYWRRNFHPEDIPPISIIEQQSPAYLKSMAKTKQELHKLSAILKHSVPFSNPRYIGHMASDLLLPGLLAQMITTLYNPNNVTEEASQVTVGLELTVGRKLATMFGFNTDDTQQEVAWGHLTSGGTLANYQSLWIFRAVKYYPLAVKKCSELSGITFTDHHGKDINQLSDWQLMNLSINQIINIRNQCLSKLKLLPPKEQKKTLALLNSQRFETLGPIDFFTQHPKLKQPVVLVPVTAHYSWQKAIKLQAIGLNNLWKVPVDEHMRLDINALQGLLTKAKEEQRPVLAVIGVLGTTEFGTIDPVAGIIKLQKHFLSQNLNFFIHIDAAWGGYLSAIFRDDNNQLLSRELIREQFKYFPSPGVYQSFAALSEVDSITVDPHKLGYIPFGSGAFVEKISTP